MPIHLKRSVSKALIIRHQSNKWGTDQNMYLIMSLETAVKKKSPQLFQSNDTWKANFNFPKVRFLQSGKRNFRQKFNKYLPRRKWELDPPKYQDIPP
jgi:hypothetical protein